MMTPTENKERGYFWLYNGDDKVAGLYGLFCQYTTAPKEYGLSDSQIATVLSNLKSKLTGVTKESTILELLSYLTDTGEIKFYNVRIMTTEGTLFKSFTLEEVLHTNWSSLREKVSKS